MDHRPLSIEHASRQSPYFRAIREYPMLTAEEELALCHRWRDRHDTSAAHRLVGCHLRMAVKIARDYRHYGLNADDLIGEGHVGLMRALCRFDPDHGARFSTYAKWWIRSAVQEYVLHNWSLVKIGTTNSQKKLFFNLRRMVNNIRDFESGELGAADVHRIATILNVPEHEVISMNRRMNGHDLSLNVPMGSDTETEWQSMLVDGADDPEATLIRGDEIVKKKSMILAALKELKERDQQIVIERRLKAKPTSLRVLSQRYGVSSERIRQIEIRAIARLRRAIRPELCARAFSARGPGADGFKFEQLATSSSEPG